MSLERAVAMFQAERFDEARRLAVDAFKVAPTNPDILRIIAICDYRLRDYDGFHSKFLKILREAPTAQALYEFVLMLHMGMTTRGAHMSRDLALTTLSTIATAMARPIIKNADAPVRERIAVGLSHVMYGIDDVLVDNIKPYCARFHDALLTDLDIAGAVDRLGAQAARFMAYLLAAATRFDTALAVMSAVGEPANATEARDAERAAGMARAAKAESGQTPQDPDDKAPAEPAFYTKDDAKQYAGSGPVLRGAKRAVKNTLPTGKRGRVLDLGCGTGAVGTCLQGRTDYLLGVDLNTARLAHAREHTNYDMLIEADVLEWLEQGGTDEAPFDTIVFAMVVPMIADLERLFTGCRERLAAGGQIGFDALVCGPGAELRRTASGQYLRPAETIRAAATNAGLIIEHEQLGQQEWGIGAFFRLKAA